MENGEERNAELYAEFCQLEEEHHRLSQNVGEQTQNKKLFWEDEQKNLNDKEKDLETKNDDKKTLETNQLLKKQLIDQTNQLLEVVNAFE